MVCLSPNELLFDEPHHMAIAEGIKTEGLIKTLKVPPSGSAPGPLYSFIHLGLAPLTGLKPLGIRLVNIVIFAGVLVLTAIIAKILQLSNPILTASTLLVVPFVYPAVGMALTDIPALFFFTLFILFFIKLIQNLEASPLAHIMLLSILSGVSLGLAIIGRQIYICALVGTLVILGKDRKTWIGLVLVVSFAVISSAWLFLIWGGLTPPGLAIGGISIIHGMLSFAYLGLATWFICPRWIKIDKLTIILSFAISIIIFLSSWHYDPASSLAQKMIPSWLFSSYARLSGIGLAIVAFIWLYSFLLNAIEERRDKKMLFLYFILIILALTPISISYQFSSKYVVTCITVLVIIISPKLKVYFVTLPRYILGISLGIATLWTYYIFWSMNSGTCFSG
jgi:hypothetical protein